VAGFGPTSEYYDGSVPSGPFGRHRTYPPESHPAGAPRWNI